MNRARITWLDDTTTVLQNTEATVTVYDTGLVVIQRGDQSRYIPASAYKWVDIDR